MFRQQPGTRGEHLVTGRDVTPNVLTHLASPDAQVIHRHSLASQLLMPFLSCASSPSRVYRHRLRKGSKRVLIKSRAVSLPPQWNGLQVDAERAGWKVDVQVTCLLRVPNSVLH